MTRLVNPYHDHESLGMAWREGYEAALAVRDAEYAALVTAAKEAVDGPCDLNEWSTYCRKHHSRLPCPVEVLRQTLTPFTQEDS